MGSPSEAVLELFAVAVVKTEEGLICDANEQLLALSGYTREELVGQPLDTLIPERFREKHRDHVREYSQVPEPRPMGPDRQVVLRQKSGQDVDVWVGLSPIEEGGCVAVVLPRNFSTRSGAPYDGRERRRYPR